MLPSGWHELQDPNSGKAYYYNEETGETTWDRPKPPVSVSNIAQNRGKSLPGHSYRSSNSNSQAQYQSKAITSHQESHQTVAYQQYSQTPSSYQGQNIAQPVTQQVHANSQAIAGPLGNDRKTLASRYGDGFVTSASHPELAQQYGNVGTSNPYTGAPRPGTAVVSPMQKKASPLSANLNMDELELSPENKVISDSLLSVIDSLEKSSFLNVSEKRQLSESRKGINILVKKMCRGLISDDIKVKVENIASALQHGDFSTANSIQTNLVNTEWKDHKDWLRGSKLLIQLAAKKS